MIYLLIVMIILKLVILLNKARNRSFMNYLLQINQFVSVILAYMMSAEILYQVEFDDQFNFYLSGMV